jgi:hypothetical protein
MTNYENVWGNTNKDWCPVDAKEKPLLSGFIALAWVGMVAFLICCALAVETKKEIWSAAALIFLFVWLAGGITAIRIIRAKRRSVTFPK